MSFQPYRIFSFNLPQQNKKNYFEGLLGIKLSFVNRVYSFRAL